MNTITATRRTIRREWTWFGTLLIISVGLMGVSGTDPVQKLESGINVALNPIETTINNFADTVDSYWSALIQLDHLRTENQQLADQNRTLQEQLSRMGAISQLNTDWTAITATQQSIPYQSTQARVIVRDTSSVSKKTLIINKGSRDGLQVGECVVDAGGALIGRISQVDSTVSAVLLVTDPTAIVVGQEAKSGATGTIRGSISGQLTMDYVDAAVPLSKGQAVVTAGEGLPGTGVNASPSPTPTATPKPTGSLKPAASAKPSPTPTPASNGGSEATMRSPYPPGLLIGTITSIDTDPNSVVQSATIQPAARLTDATFVLVILNYQGGFVAPAANSTPLPPITPAPSPSGAPGSSKPKATPTPGY